MALLLTAAEIEPLLDLRQAIAVLERAYRQQAEGQLDESPPLRLMGRKIRLVAGGLPLDGRVGVRLSAGPGGPSVSAGSLADSRAAAAGSATALPTGISTTAGATGDRRATSGGAAYGGSAPAGMRAADATGDRRATSGAAADGGSAPAGMRAAGATGDRRATSGDDVAEAHGAAGDGAVALLYDGAGRLLCIMGYPFSDLRLVATMALAIERMAQREARKVALIGSGRLAPQALRAAVAVRPVASVAVYSPTAGHRERFAAREAAALGIPVEPAASAEQALDGADIVLVSTNSSTPTLLGRWLSSEQSVFGCGRPNEFDDEVYLRAGLVVVSSKAHEQGYYDTGLDRPLIRLADAGTIPWGAVAELGQLVAGQVASRGMPVFRESQGGYSDVALASWAYDQALVRGLGREFSF